MNKFIIVLLIFAFDIFSVSASSQIDSTPVESIVILHTKSGDIFGTLTTPREYNDIPVALIIAGSGPTDRNGNNPMMKNNSLKILATELATKNIATLRFDKRGIGESTAAGKKESELRFDDYVQDAKEWLELLKKDKHFSNVIVIGHSEGSLIGMIAAQGADKFVSIAGAGQSADKIIKEQLTTQPKEIKDLCYAIIDSLADGKKVENVPPMLNSLFRPSVQPYMISWFKYDPQTEIKKLSIPILILQGTNDLQISVEDAKRLANSNQGSKMILIEQMNHIFRIVNGDRQSNISTYSNTEMDIANELVESISAFIQNK